MMPEARELLTIAQAMARVHVSRRTIYNWMKLGKIQYERTAGGGVRIDADSLWRPAAEPPPEPPAAA